LKNSIGSVLSSTADVVGTERSDCESIGVAVTTRRFNDDDRSERRADPKEGLRVDDVDLEFAVELRVRDRDRDRGLVKTFAVMSI
jgi:hypothetical protein